MAYNTFTGGVNTSFSTELNENFKGARQGHLANGAVTHLSLTGDNAKSYDQKTVFLNIDNTSNFATTTNLSTLNGGNVSSHTAGAYEAETGDIYFIDSSTEYYVQADYNIFKAIRTSTLSSTAPSPGSDSDDDSTDLVNEKVVWFGFNMGNGDGSSTVVLTDGSNDVTLYSSSSGGSANQAVDGVIKLHFDYANDQVYVIRNIEQSSGADEISQSRISCDLVDISSLTGGNYYIGTKATAGAGGSGDCSVYYIRSSKSSPSTTATLTISGDGGSTDDSVTNGSVGNLTSTSQRCSVKLAGTIAAGEGIEINNITIRQV